MSDIQFDEEQGFSQSIKTIEPSLFMRLVYKTGLVHTERGAEYFLLGVAVVGILFTIFMLFSGGGKSKPPVPSITGLPAGVTR